VYDLPENLVPLFTRLQVLIAAKGSLHWKHFNIGPKRILAVHVLEFLHGVRHIAFVIPDLSIDDARAISVDGNGIKEELEKIKFVMTGYSDADTEPEGSDDLPLSNRVFVFTTNVQGVHSDIRRVLKNNGRRVVIIDDMEWQRRLAMRKPDAFIAHDTRDKDELARPLAYALARLGLVVWFDEFSLRPGNRLSEAIDRGLTNCRRAVLLVTPNLLENNSWGATELSTLLTRAAYEPNTIIPVWARVGRTEVAARSARLADIVAIHARPNIDELASEIYAAVGGPEGDTTIG
jgi:hypothetical protein